MRGTDMVLMTGDAIAWSEPHRDHCPTCKGRDLEAERARGYDRLCLRCLTWTHDPPGWDSPRARAGLTAQAKSDQERREATEAYWVARREAEEAEDREREERARKSATDAKKAARGMLTAALARVERLAPREPRRLRHPVRKPADHIVAREIEESF